MEDLKELKVKNWKEAAKDKRTWTDLVPNDDDDDNYDYDDTKYTTIPCITLSW
jgi:hypothetical protein